VFGSFVSGAKEGFASLLSVAPSLVGLIIAVTMLEGSGFFAMISEWLSPVCNMIGCPAEVLPLGIMRPVTGSGSYALLNTLLQQYGADSLIGKTASVMAGSTETTFYAIAVYYGAIGIRKTRFTIPAALTADLTSMIMAVMCVRFFG